MTNDKSFILDGAFEAMRKLKERGTESIEISQHIQFNEETIPQIKKAQEDFGMGVCAMSCRFTGGLEMALPQMAVEGVKLKTYTIDDDAFDELVSYCKVYDCHYIRFASLPGRQMPDMKTVEKYMANAEAMAVRLEAEGIHFAAHNHAEEFLKVEGKTIFDWSLELAPHLQYEIDVLNIFKTAQDPIKIIEKCGPRAALLHVQDMRIKPIEAGDPLMIMGPELYQPCEVGGGLVDYAAVVNAAAKAGSQYLIVEQGRFYGKDPYDCIETSLNTLKKMV